MLNQKTISILYALSGLFMLIGWAWDGWLGWVFLTAGAALALWLHLVEEPGRG